MGKKILKFYFLNVKLNWGMFIFFILKKIFLIIDLCILVKIFIGNNFKILNFLNFIDVFWMFFDL